MSILDRFRLDGRVALVIGGGRGIGAACALGLADVGADVAVFARTQSQVESVALQIRERSRRGIALCGDVTSEDDMTMAVDQTVDRLGRLDVLVCVTGGSFPKPFLDTSDRSFGIAFERNVVDGLRAVRLCVPHLLASPCASIVMISSAVGHVSGRGYVAYGASKAALDHAVQILSLELNPKIRINAVAPGAILTEALEMVASTTDIVDQLAANTPLGYVGKPEDIAGAVTFLATPASGYVTGQILAVDGGLIAPNLPAAQPDL